MEKLNYVLEFYLQLDKEEPDEEKAKAILTEKLKKIINDPNFNPLGYGGLARHVSKFSKPLHLNLL